MHRLSVIFILLLLSGVLAAASAGAVMGAGGPAFELGSEPEVIAAEQDSTAIAALDEKLAEYLAALETEPIEVKCQETDFLISSCRDSSVRQRVALQIYEHYYLSKLMGDESVAIHIFDRWFSDGTVSMGSDEDFYGAQFYARLNRPSLIGCRAPQLDLLTPDGEPVSLFSGAGNNGSDGELGHPDSGNENSDAETVRPAAGNGRYRILYFYDVNCAKCLVESILMRNILQERDYDAVLYAVYVGPDEAAWAEYRKEQLSIDSPNLDIYHFYDPEMTSGFALKYAVTGTPRMFLVDRQGIIIGRGLDAEALDRLLTSAIERETLNYGSDEAMEMYDKVFAFGSDESSGSSSGSGSGKAGDESGGSSRTNSWNTGCGDVSEVAGHIADRLLPSGDTLMYKQMIGDLLYYLTNRREARFKCGTAAFADKYILERGDIWNTPDDSLKVVSLAGFMKYMTSLCPVGEKLPALEVPATVMTAKKSKAGTVRLDKQRRAAVIFFSEGCGLCKAEIEAAGAAMASGSGQFKRVILIDMDEIWSSPHGLSDELMQHFDLSALPLVLSLDRRGRVSDKYLSLQ